jgi:hypothetical protein
MPESCRPGPKHGRRCRIGNGNGEGGTGALCLAITFALHYRSTCSVSSGHNHVSCFIFHPEKACYKQSGAYLRLRPSAGLRVRRVATALTTYIKASFKWQCNLCRDERVLTQHSNLQQMACMVSSVRVHLAHITAIWPTGSTRCSPRKIYNDDNPHVHDSTPKTNPSRASPTACGDHERYPPGSTPREPQPFA